LPRRLNVTLVVLVLSAPACKPTARPSGASTAPTSQTLATTKPIPNALYHRLGGEPAIRYIVDDFVARAAANPKLARTQASTHDLADIKQRLVAFLVFSTGGPQLDNPGAIAKDTQAMTITADEFDAALADLKASLVALNVAPRESSELLSLANRLRPAILSQNAK
jgi:truncated hemoglobin YjbI